MGLSGALAHLAFAAAAALLLVAAGQPIFTDDAWWHLALGRAYLAEGPWLAADPLLFTAPGPPAPASWLADAALYALWSATGFTGLRVLHVATLAAILALAWRIAARATGSRALASAIGTAFVALVAYRGVQLRPELFTIGATLGVYALLVAPARLPSWRRVAASAGLFAVWANVHAGFVLGLLLLGAAAAGLLLAAPLRDAAQRPRDRARAVRLALAAAFGCAAGLANPSGVGAHLAFARAGQGTPELARVADEWARFAPFAWPVPYLPPTPLAFALVWLLLLATPLALAVALRRWRRADPEPGADPAQWGWSLASLLALLSAVRFLWLGLFPLVALAQLARRRVPAWAAGACALALVPAFVRCGDWRMISGLLPQSATEYAQPYSAAKYFAHPLWFLGDAGLEGHVYTDYFMGGFTGFFGAPALKTFSNGSLNVSREAIEANRAIRARRGLLPGESFEALLDRFGVDLFVGTRLPRSADPYRPWFYSTAHLERTPGWLCVFRNLDSAVYLRLNERNRANLERVAAFYERAGVPFSPETGFDALRVAREQRSFAIERGLLPANIEAVAEAAEGRDSELRRAANAQLSSLYAALGAYERAIALARAALRADPVDLPARRHLVWSLLRADRIEEAQAEAAALRDTQLPLARAIGEAAQEAARESAPTPPPGARAWRHCRCSPRPRRGADGERGVAGSAGGREGALDERSARQVDCPDKEQHATHDVGQRRGTRPTGSTSRCE